MPNLSKIRSSERDVITRVAIQLNKNSPIITLEINIIDSNLDFTNLQVLFLPEGY